MKRLTDLMVAFSGIIIFFPLATVIAAAIKISSPGPVLFRQKRLGQHNVPFVIYKFRTMAANSEPLGAATFPGDIRITRVGKLLRPMHLDELPQLLNILMGQMTLIGPRPRPVAHCNEITNFIPNFLTRHAVKPGLTGLAQVRNNIDHTMEGLKESFLLDMEYIQKRSVALDLKILAMTITTVFQRRGV